MISPVELAQAFRRNVVYLDQRIAGIGHHASLEQPGGEANCLNWTVGHIAYYRNLVLDHLGVAPVGDEGELDRYVRESEPILGDGPGVVRFERLVELVNASQEPLDAAMKALGDADLEQVVKRGERHATLGERLFFFYFHDTLHVGQADVLAALEG